LAGGSGQGGRGALIGFHDRVVVIARLNQLAQPVGAVQPAAAATAAALALPDPELTRPRAVGFERALVLGSSALANLNPSLGDAAALAVSANMPVKHESEKLALARAALHHFGVFGRRAQGETAAAG